MAGTPLLYEVQKLYVVGDRLDSLAEQHPNVSEALITISGSVRNTATWLERFTRICNFTPRELAVIDNLCEALDNRGIAEKMGISTMSVKHHIQSIGEKMGIDREKYHVRIRIVYLMFLQHVWQGTEGEFLRYGRHGFEGGAKIKLEEPSNLSGRHEKPRQRLAA